MARMYFFSPPSPFPLFLYSLHMSKVGKALAVSFGALAGGAAGFYVLEMYKIKSKVGNRLCSSLSKMEADWDLISHRRKD